MSPSPREPSPGQQDDEREDGQVSEVASLGSPADADDPITPGDATAGYPFEEAESGRPDEGTAGPNAAPRHGRTEPTNESSR
jgi:hypothetical protein